MFYASTRWFLSPVFPALCIQAAWGIGILYDGRAPLNLTEASIDASEGPYLTGVKGFFRNASHYTTLLRPYHVPPTPLWNEPVAAEQVLSIKIDNSSVFIPGGGTPQYGFRRTELIAQRNGSSSTADLDAELDAGVTVFHFSIRLDESLPLNYDHEYQIVFIEPSDGTHVFGIQLGSPFTDPTETLPAPDSHSFKVLDHALNVLFKAHFTSQTWHNFAIQVDWDQRTLAVFYSHDDQPLTGVTKNPLPNTTTGLGAVGDFHFGLLKLPLVNPADTPADQADVVHYGLQDVTTEGLLYSGVFVESASSGVSAGGRAVIPLIV